MHTKRPQFLKIYLQRPIQIFTNLIGSLIDMMEGNSIGVFEDWGNPLFTSASYEDCKDRLRQVFTVLLHRYSKTKLDITDITDRHGKFISSWVTFKCNCAVECPRRFKVRLSCLEVTVIKFYIIIILFILSCR